MERNMAKSSIILIGSLLIGCGSAFAFGEKPAEPKPTKDNIDRALEVIIKTPDSIRTIEERRKRDAEDWEKLDKSKPKLQ